MQYLIAKRTLFYIKTAKDDMAIAKEQESCRVEAKHVGNLCQKTFKDNKEAKSYTNG